MDYNDMAKAMDVRLEKQKDKSVDVKRVCYAQGSIPIDQWEGGILDISIINGISMKYITNQKTIDQYGNTMITFYYESA